jgi:hypothetical protein
MRFRGVLRRGITRQGRAFGPDTIRSWLLFAACVVAVATPGVAAADDWHVGDAGLRGLDDGQTIGVHELSGLFPAATVIEANPGRFEIRLPGRATPAVDPAVDQEVAAVVSTGTLTSVIVYGPEVRASSGLGVGSTIADLAAAVPELECSRWDPDIACSSAYGRFTFFARGPVQAVPADLATASDYTVMWWSWTGSGRPRSASAKKMKDWRAERGGLGPIDRQTRPTKANLESLLPGLVVTEQADNKLGKFFVVGTKKGKAALFWMRVWADHMVTLAITSPKFPTASGARVGDTLGAIRLLEPKLSCNHTWSRGPSGGMHGVTCAGDGVEYWFQIEHVTGNEQLVVPPAVDLDASKDLVLEAIHVVLQ